MEKSLVLKKDILSAFNELGIKNGQTIEVHTSLSSFGFVCGGAQIVIEALLEAVGEEGTIHKVGKILTQVQAFIGKNLKNGGKLSEIIGLLTTRILRPQTQWVLLPKCLENGQAL